MRVPLSWLADYVVLPEDVTPEQVQADLVKVGFEEEDIHGGDISGPIVVGEVLEFTPEEQNNGKTIRWCQVRVAPDGEVAADGGDAIHGIVCGASNFLVGDKVVVTLPGAVLPGPFPIAARKTYGHVSDGMMASAKELGLSENHDGIIRLSEMGLDPEVGTDALELLGLSESAIEINVTPDRGYAFSIRGVAREYSHSTGKPFRDPAEICADLAEVEFGAVYPVSVEDTAPIRGRVGCSIFATRVVRGVDAQAATPSWMVNRLKLAGIRSISLPVDISNYVMLELGQPNHCYDLDKLSGDILVRRANSGEKITTLDEVERTLHPEDLLITSGGKPVGIAGVMGGANTEIDAHTTNVLVEAANFDPVSIARSARRHKLPSEASKRFERGVDPAVAAVAAGRVAALLVELAGGTIVDEGSYLGEIPAATTIELPAGFVSALIGYDYTDDQIVSSLEEIGCQVTSSSSGYQVTVPSWRPDLTDKWTLAEEVARICGYDLIPAVIPVAPPGRGYTVAQQVRRRIAQTLASTGHTEVLSYPFFDQDTNNLFGLATAASVPQVHLVNALDSEAGWMRTSLLPGLLQTAARNRSRGLVNLSLFEMGSVFLPEAGVTYGHGLYPGAQRPTAAEEAEINAGIPPQPRYVSGVFSGEAIEKQPGQAAVPFSWQDAITAVNQISLAAGVRIDVRQGNHKSFHPGRTAELVVGDRVIGYAGEILPAIAESYHLPRVCAAFEINLDLLTEEAGVVHVASDVKTMPAATQDISLVVDRTVSAAVLREALVSGAGELLEAAQLVDIYQGPGIDEDKQSVTFALRFRAPDRTLTAAEATAAKESGLAEAAKRFSATLRE